MNRIRILAAKTALVIAIAIGIMTPTYAGIPTINAGDIVQTSITAFEPIAQTLKQVEQYQTQLQQYEDMLQNTMTPAAYIWD